MKRRQATKTFGITQGKQPNCPKFFIFTCIKSKNLIDAFRKKHPLGICHARLDCFASKCYQQVNLPSPLHASQTGATLLLRRCEACALSQLNVLKGGVQ